MNPGGQRKITRTQYDALTPEGQGYESYMQAAWNENVPNNCPFPEESDMAEEWRRGQHKAYLAVLDSEE